MGKSSSAPPPPDYAGAAAATAQGNLEAARVAAKANRVSQYTPYGNLIYQQGGGLNQNAYDQAVKSYQDQLAKYTAAGGDNQQQFIQQAFPSESGGEEYRSVLNPDYIAKPNAPNQLDYTLMGDPDVWSSTVQLTPEQQQLLDQQNKTSLQLASLQDQGVGYVQNMLDKPFDVGALPAQTINAGQTAQDAIMSRLQPQFDRRQAQLETQLANQGISRGTEAWKNAQTDLDQARNDAYIQSALQGMGIGQQARQQGLQEQAFLRNEPLNTLNAVRTGAQVTNPTFSNVPQQATTQGPDMLGAAQAGYNAQMNNYNAQQAGNQGLMGGLFGLGSAIAGLPVAGGGSIGGNFISGLIG